MEGRDTAPSGEEGQPDLGAGGIGSPHFIHEDTSPWQDNAIRALEDSQAEVIASFQQPIFANQIGL